MIVPNKAISYQQSLLSKMPAALIIIGAGRISPPELYHKMRPEFDGINQFVLMMDALFILGKIKLDEGELVIC